MGISGRIAALFLRNSMTPLLALIAMLLGIFATLVTPREEEPQINVTMANVFVPFPGASARDVEQLVARPAEQVLSRISGVEHIYSMSRPGMAVITVQYLVGEDPIQALVRLYDTINANSDWLSPNLGVLPPIVKPKGIDDVPIVTLTLWSDDPTKSGFDLQQVARAAEIDLKRIPGTRDVVTIGGPGHVIRVTMDSDRMSAHGVTAQDLKNALQVSNASQPSGSLVSGNREIMVQTGTFIESAADVKRLVVGVHDGKPVFMADVAKIEDGPDISKRYVWHGLGKAAGTQGEHRAGYESPAVTLSISKKPGVNAADVASQVIARANALKGTVIPEGVELLGDAQLRRDRHRQGAEADRQAGLRHRLRRAAGAVRAGPARGGDRRRGGDADPGGHAVRLLGLGLHPQPGVAVRADLLHRHPRRRRHRRGREHPPLAHALPGKDDGRDHSRRGRRSRRADHPRHLHRDRRAAADGLRLGPDGPLHEPDPDQCLDGHVHLAGDRLRHYPVAGAETDEARRPWPWRRRQDHGPADGAFPPHHDALPRAPRPPRKLERQAAHRKLWLGIAIAIIASVSLGVFKLVVLKMLPFDNKSEFQVVLDMPVGTPLEETARVLREMSAYLATVEEVKDYQAYAGAASPINFNGLVRQYYLRSSPEMGDIQVNLVDKKHRERKSHEVAVGVRKTIAEIAYAAGGNAKVVEVPPGPPVMSPIVAEIYGPEYSGQIEVAKKVRHAFESTADIYDVDDSVDENAEKLVLRVNQAKAAQLGVAQMDIVETVRMGLSGEDVTPVHGGDTKYEIPVRITLPAERQDSLDQLLKLKVRAMAAYGGKMVPISELVEVKKTLRDKVIFHKDLLPVVYVFGDMGGKLDSPLYGMFDIRARIKDAPLQQGGTLGEYFIKQPKDPYAGYTVKWDGEWQVTYETFRDMGIAYAVGLVLIYLLVVAQFKSYLVPLIIMAPIPLTIIGVMPGHALLGEQFTATSMIGMIALAGIIVRNSILLVDFINDQVAGGMDFAQAVIESAAIRAKPIALTGLAAMLGALFILDDPIFSGLAISLIFGIFVSTVLTLVVIPVLYYSTMKTRLQRG